MTSLRYRLERELWRQGVKVALLPGQDSPQVTRYPLLMPDGVTSDDIDKVLSQVSGRLSLGGLRGVWQSDGLYGLEVARQDRAVVAFADMPVSEGAAIPWLLGMSTSGKVLTVDLAKAPHLLIAGETGSGKSNHVAGALASLVKHHSPEAVRLCLLDPKQVDLLSFADVPHTLTHTTNSKHFADTLTALCDEMQRRYAAFKRAKTRDIDAYNATGEHLPRLVCIFDESAAAIGSNQKELEHPVLQLLQMGRAAGIHLILAMQRPNSTVLSPTARLNLPLRIAFRMLDGASSRLVIDSPDATNLLGNGDGLLLGKDNGLTRFQSPLATDKDLAKATEAASRYTTPAFSLGGLGNEADAVAIPEGLSRLDKAKVLCEYLDYIAPTDLLEHGIADSKSTAKVVLSQLRDAGYIGAYDKSKKASPTRHQLDTLDSQPHSVSPSLDSPLASEKASNTGNVRNIRLNGARVRTVN